MLSHFVSNTLCLVLFVTENVNSVTPSYLNLSALDVSVAFPQAAPAYFPCSGN